MRHSPGMMRSGELLAIYSDVGGRRQCGCELREKHPRSAAPPVLVPGDAGEALSTSLDEAQSANSSPDGALDALTQLVAETEQRRSQQVQRIAELAERDGAAVLAERVIAERVLKEVEATLGMARAYQSILQSLDAT